MVHKSIFKPEAACELIEEAALGPLVRVDGKARGRVEFHTLRFGHSRGHDRVDIDGACEFVDQERFRLAKAMEGYLNNGTEGKTKPVRSTKMTDAFRLAAQGGVAVADIGSGTGTGAPQASTNGNR